MNSLNPTLVNDDALTYNLEDSTPKMVETVDIDEPKTTAPSVAPATTNNKPPSSRLKKKDIPFWTEDPNILVKPAYIMEFFPVNDMTFNQSMNAITRTVVVLTIITYLFTHNARIVSIAVLTILAIFLLHYAKSKEQCKRKSKNLEGFSNDKYVLNDIDRHSRFYDYQGPLVDVEGDFDTTFDKSTPDNPLSNVLISDYDYNPNKKPAPPSFTKDGNGVIVQNTKDMVQDLNPGQPNIEKKLYNDINTNMELEQSLRQFYSTANTTIPNNQAGFAEFCYGNMISGKEENKIALTRENPRHIMR
jgi:hypothetical protein